MKGYDIDGVLANFQKSFYEWFNKPYIEPVIWEDPFILKNFHIIKNDPTFWLSIEPFPELNSEGDIYITHRNIDVGVTIEWLNKVGCPKALVISVKDGNKIPPALDYNVKSFLDDKPQNVQDLLNVGIEAYLLDRAWNKESDLPRVYSIEEYERKTR